MHTRQSTVELVSARLVFAAVFAFAQLLGPLSIASASAAAALEAPDSEASQPDFGSNVMIFDPSMSTATIQAVVDAIAAQQVSNQFGPQRYALLFKPGTYGSTAAPPQL